LEGALSSAREASEKLATEAEAVVSELDDRGEDLHLWHEPLPDCHRSGQKRSGRGVNRFELGDREHDHAVIAFAGDQLGLLDIGDEDLLLLSTEGV
jgi:hypothetical protein